MTDKKPGPDRHHSVTRPSSRNGRVGAPFAPAHSKRTDRGGLSRRRELVKRPRKGLS